MDKNNDGFHWLIVMGTSGKRPPAHRQPGAG
jgi:hypothetical protein